MALKYVQTNTLYQAGAGNIIGATTVVLTTFSDIYGNVLTMSDFGAKGYITLEPDTTNEEGATFTGVTPNANGTYTLTGVSTILAKSPYTETSGLVRQHSGGTKIVVTDNVAFWNTFANKVNDETITGRWGSATVPVANSDYVNKLYADNLAIAGAPNATTGVKGILQLSTQAQVLSKTATGSTGAALAVTPDVMASTLLSDYVIDTGAADAYAIAPSPAITAYTTGQIFTFKSIHTNTTASTINVNGLGAKAIKKYGTIALVAGDIVSGTIYMVEYDGTNFQLLSDTSEVKMGQNSQEVYAADSVGSDSYAITLVPAITAYVTGQVFNFKAGTANTGAATLAVNGLSAISIVKKGNVALNTGDILSGQIVQVVYDGTNFQMTSPPSLPFYGLSASGSTTYDLSTASGTQNIAHGLGVTPKIFNVYIAHAPAGGVISIAMAANTSVTGALTQSGAGVVSDLFVAGQTSSAYQTALVTVDATNIILTWTKTSTPTGTVTIVWNALA